MAGMRSRASRAPASTLSLKIHTSRSSLRQDNDMNLLQGGLSAVPGIRSAGIAAGIKKADALDLALIVSDCSAAVAGVFTKNAVPAAPVLLTRSRIRKGQCRAILANSGNANACTGQQGYNDAVA